MMISNGLIRLVLSASMIPVGATVQRLGEPRRYTLLHRVVLESESGEILRSVTADDGCVLLTLGSGHLLAISGSSELIWNASPEEALSYLRRDH